MATAIIIESDLTFDRPPIAPHSHGAGDITSGRFSLARMPGGASAGQVMQWDGSAWVFATVQASGGVDDFGTFTAPATGGSDYGGF